MELKEKLKQLNPVWKCMAALVMPWIACALYLLVRGIRISDIYLPNFYNNDALFYYKTVESIVNFGMPRGFFGYNESRAVIGSLGAWNPLIFGPWALWGLAFGWNYSSIFVCNITVISLAFMGFVALTKPEWKQLGVAFILTLFFPSFELHLLSGVAEAPVGAIIILFFGLAINMEQQGFKLVKYILLLVCGVYLTVVRPYNIVLLIFVVFIAAKKNRKTLLPGIFVAVMSVLLYLLTTKYMTADYLVPIFDTYLFDLILGFHPIGAIRYVIQKLSYSGKDLLSAITGAYSYGLTIGTHYVIVFIAAIILLAQSFKKGKSGKGVKWMLVVHFIVLLGAVVLLYNVPEGGRHLWGIAIICIFMLAMEIPSVLGLTGAAAIGISLLIFVLRGALVPTDYDVPVRNDAVKANIEYWEDQYSKRVNITDSVDYENTLIWVLWDSVDGERKATNHREIYAVPAGMGINCCTNDYVIDNFNGLKSKYIATVPGGSIDLMCIEGGCLEIGRTSELAVFEIR